MLIVTKLTVVAPQHTCNIRYQRNDENYKQGIEIVRIKNVKELHQQHSIGEIIEKSEQCWGDRGNERKFAVQMDRCW